LTRFRLSREAITAAVAVCLALTSLPLAAQTLANQATDPTVLKQVIIFGRHGVRSAALPASTLAAFTSRPYPDFGVPTGYLTVNGAKNEVLLGSYFRAYLTAEGLLTGEHTADAQKSYFRANSIQRSNISAASLATGIFPSASVPVHSYALGQPDPVFDPIAGKIVTPDLARAAKEVSGIFNGSSIPATYSSEFSIVRSAIYNYPFYTAPAPPAPPGVADPTTIPIPLTANTANIQTANVINAGGLGNTLYAADPFVMEYADGMSLSNVAWGQLSLNQLSQQTRIITLDFAIEMTPPYLNQVQSSNAAAHILRSMEQAATGKSVPGAFSAPGTNLLVINSSDAYVVGVAGLLRMHWMLPGYQQDYNPPGGSLVFELRQVRATGEYVVRVYFTAQTFDQLRFMTPLTASQPLATMQLLIPNGSKSSTDLDVPFTKFKKLLIKAINPHLVQDPSAEVPPGPLTGVPLK
jgi:4-phytase / acid phosphatase